jgi:hypothetical protein
MLLLTTTAGREQLHSNTTLVTSHLTPATSAGHERLKDLQRQDSIGRSFILGDSSSPLHPQLRPEEHRGEQKKP